MLFNLLTNPVYKICVFYFSHLVANLFIIGK